MRTLNTNNRRNTMGNSTRWVAGFTLIELAVTMVILALLAATALPKFVNFIGGSNGARFATVQGQAAAFQTAVTGIQAKWLALGQPSSGSFTTANGTTVTISTSATAGNVYGGGFTSTTTPAPGAIMVDATVTGATTSALWSSIMQGGALPSTWSVSSGGPSTSTNTLGSAFASSPGSGQETFYLTNKSTCGFTYSEGDLSIYVSASGNC